MNTYRPPRFLLKIILDYMVFEHGARNLCLTLGVGEIVQKSLPARVLNGPPGIGSISDEIISFDIKSVWAKHLPSALVCLMDRND